MDNKRIIDTLRITGKIKVTDEELLDKVSKSEASLKVCWDKIKSLYEANKLNLSDIEVALVFLNTLVKRYEIDKSSEKERMEEVLVYLENYMKCVYEKDLMVIVNFISDVSNIVLSSRNKNLLKLMQINKRTKIVIDNRIYDLDLWFEENCYSVFYDESSTEQFSLFKIKDNKLETFEAKKAEDNYHLIDTVLHGDFDLLIIPKLNLFHQNILKNYNTQNMTNGEYLEYLITFVTQRENIISKALNEYWRIYDNELDVKDILKVLGFYDRLDFSMSLKLLDCLLDKKGVENRLEKIQEILEMYRDMLVFKDINAFMARLLIKLRSVDDIEEALDIMRHVSKSEVTEVTCKKRDINYLVEIKGDEVVGYGEDMGVYITEKNNMRIKNGARRRKVYRLVVE